MDVTSILHAALLGVVQGITEFLPVSSSAHLIVISWLTDGKPIPLSVNVALHLGTAIALLGFFWRDWWNLALAVLRFLRTREKSFQSHVLFPALIVGSIPAGVLGILFEDKIEALFHHPFSVILPLALVGVVLWLVDKHAPSEKTLNQISVSASLWIGVAQACALIPGVSRSGATILGGRIQGFTRESAARYSFLLATPAMVGAAILHAKDIVHSIVDPAFAVGLMMSFVVGCLAIGWLLRFLRTSGFASFAIYRVAVALVILIIAFCDYFKI